MPSPRIFLPALLLLASTIVAQAQVEQFVVLLPTHTSSGTYAGDYDIKGVKLSADGFVDWGLGEPRILSNLEVREHSPTAAPDGSSGFYLTYTVEYTDSANLGDRDVLIRRKDATGMDVWNDSTTGGVLFVAQSGHYEMNPIAIPSGDGVIVIYEIYYSSGDFAGDFDIAAQRIRSDGTLAWEKPVTIANREGREHLRGAYTDGLGNVVVIFERTNGSDSTAQSDIVAARIDGDGTLGWGAGVIEVVVGGSPHSEENLSMQPDGNGGAVIAYELRYMSGERKGDIDIIAQSISASGERKWIDPAAPPIVSSIRNAYEVSPTLSIDSTGVTIAFEVFNTPSARSGRPDFVGVQRLNANGRALWNGGQRASVVAVKYRRAFSPIARPEGSGGTYVLVEAEDTVTHDVDVYLQFFDRDGVPVLGANKQAIPVFEGPMPEELPMVVNDAQGGIVVIAVENPSYRVSTITSRDTTIIAQRMNARGERTWNLGGTNLTVTRCQLGEYAPSIVSSR